MYVFEKIFVFGSANRAVYLLLHYLSETDNRIQWSPEFVPHGRE